jgi:methyl-accepting chemotaxis protein
MPAIQRARRGAGVMRADLDRLRTAGTRALTLRAVASRNDAATRLMVAVTLPLYPALLLAQWAGAPWQIDLHMLVVAVLAALAVLGDWRAIIAATLVIAVHHLGAGLLRPAWVFPVGADLARALLHTGIVVVEAAMLIPLALRLERAIVGQARSQAATEAAEQGAAAIRAAVTADQTTVLAALGAGLEALSDGNLTHRLRDGFPDRYEGLRRDFNQALRALDAALAKVAAATQGITHGAGHIRLASDALALRTQRQAASLQQTAAAMTQVTATIGTTAAAAGRAHGVIAGMRGDVERGGAVVARAVEAMGRIEQSSLRIAEIISLIDGIAVQTNLLALNAGIEAARAGEAGRGFAVVASEVRALAQRSAEAAQDVGAIITASTREVEAGVRLVRETGTALQRLVAGIGDVATLVAAVSGTTEQQAQSLYQITTTIADMNGVTQQNAAMIEQATAAAQSLAGAAAELARQVDHFRIGPEPGADFGAGEADRSITRRPLYRPRAPAHQTALPAPAG